MKTSGSHSRDAPPFRIVDLNYFSIYLRDILAAHEFYSSLFGNPEYVEGENEIIGWRMGSTWLTVFASASGPCPDSDPRNAEFAIQVAAVEEVDALYEALIAAGAKACMKPRDTTMYERMRYCCVDDPFGVRIDVYCPLVGQ